MHTREHATIVYDTTKWGSPCATVEVRHPEPGLVYGTSGWHLISSVGMPGLSALRSDGQPWTYHVYRVDGHHGKGALGQWYGCTSHPGLEDSIDELLADLSAWEAERELRDSIDDHLYRLRSELDRLNDDESPHKPGSIRRRWPQVQEIFAQIQGILFEAPATPPPGPRPAPPLHPWAAIVGWLDRETVDHRYWTSTGDYTMRSAPIPVTTLDGVVGEAHRLKRQGDQVWMFGLTEDAALAARINSGEVWLGPSVEPNGDIDHSGGVCFFHGGVQIQALRVGTLADNPWGDPVN